MKVHSLFLPLVAVAASAVADPIPVADLQRREPVDFGREIYPVLKQNCLACHNTTKAKANLNMESSALMLKGGDSGPAISPGKSADSLLLKSAAHVDEDLIMPPPGNKANAIALTSEQLGLLRLWIDQGAKGEAVDIKVPLVWRAQAGSGPAQAAAISPDGRLAAVGRANRLELCELITGRVIARLGDPDLARLAEWKDQIVADRDAVMSAAFASDDLLATGGFRTVRLWRRMPRVVKRDYGALPDTATSLAVSADGKWGAAGDAKGDVWLWRADAEKFEPVQLKAHTAPITALVFSPDIAGLISTAEDKSVCGWDVGNHVVAFKGQTPAVIHSLASVTGSSEILAGCADGVVRIWTWPKEVPAEVPTPVREFKLQDQPLLALTSAPDGTFIWADSDGSLHVSGVNDGRELRRITPEHPFVRRVAFLEHELRVAQGLANARKAQVAAAAEKLKKESESARNAAQVREKARAEARRKNAEAELATEALRLTPDDKALQNASRKAAQAAATAEAALREAKVNAELGIRLAGEAATANAVAESAQAGAEASVAEAQTALDVAKKLAAEPLPAPRQILLSWAGDFMLVGADGRIRHTAIDSGALLEAPDRAGIAASAPSGELLIVGPDRRVRLTSARRVWALERVLGQPDDPKILADRVTAIAFSPDGKLLATGGGIPSREGELKLWRVADGTLAKEITKAHADTINSVAFSPDGEFLASAGSDRLARIWQVADGSRVAGLEGHTGHVLSVAWRADGLALATGGADRTARLWDVSSRKQTKNINSFGAEVAAVAFVGAGEALLAASGDKTVRLGDKQLPDSASMFPFCATSDLTGRFVAAGGQDGVLRVWSVAERKLVRTFAPGTAMAAQ